MDIIIVRCNNVFGVKQYPEKVIPLFIQKALRGEALTIHGETGKIRDFIHTSDVNNAVMSILTVSYTHLRAHETLMNRVFRLLLEKKVPWWVVGVFFGGMCV